MSPTSVCSGRRIRILHIVQNLNYGGMERLMFDLIRSQDSSVFESHVLVLEYVGRFGEGLSAHCTVSTASPMGRFSMVHPRSLATDIRRIAPDVVHCHSGVWYKAVRAARLAGVRKLVFTEHGRAIRTSLLVRLIDYAASRGTDSIVAVSESVAAQLETVVGRSAARIHVVPNGIDVSRFAEVKDDGAVRAEFRLSPDRPIIGSVGRLESIKGFDVMIEAFGRLMRLAEHGSSPVLLIAGDGSQRQRLERMVRQLGLSQSVLMPGWRDDLASLYGSFSIFSMASHSEGTSIALLEAMSAGLCPVVTDVGGNRAVLGSTLEHRLIPSNDPEALALAWFGAFADRSRLVRDSKAARDRVSSHYSLRGMVKRYESIYHTLSAEIRGSRQPR